MEKDSKAISIWNGATDANWYKESTAKFTITKAEQLAGLAELINSGIDFKDKIINLDSDITLNKIIGWEDWAANPPANTWTPIGTEARPFNGTFDGNKHTIIGIYINSDNCKQGLFGYIDSNGEIKNLRVGASYIKGNTMVSGLVGASKGAISNSCYFGNVKGNNKVGGLVGANEGIISGCYSYSKVTGDYDESDIGGLVGENWGKISDSYSAGAVTGKDNVGGLVGRNVHKIYGNCKDDIHDINNSYSACIVTGTRENTGGLVGRKSPTCAISNSYYDSQVSTQSDMGKGDGKATEEMKKKETYEKWDFDEIWKVDHTNSGYPSLPQITP